MTENFADDFIETPKSSEKKRVAILTNFQDFNSGYSLTGIAVEQCRMLLQHGHNVYLYVNENFNPEYNKGAGLESLQDRYPHMLATLKKTKFIHLRDYTTAMLFTAEHKAAAEETSDIYVEEFLKRKIDVVFTHDFIFTGWNLPYAAAIKITSEKLAQHGVILKWLHWIHSVPSNKKDWWNLHDYGPGHKIIFPNRTEINRVAEHFSTNPSYVQCIPHIKDIRTWYDFCDETNKIIHQYPNLMKADVIQVYPCSTDRLSAKQLDLVIRIFSEMKKSKANVFLVAANQWATGRQRKEDIQMYIKLAKHLNLKYGENFIFTSEFSSHPNLIHDIENAETVEKLRGIFENNRSHLKGKLGEVTDENLINKKGELIDRLKPYNKGISAQILRELQLLSNLFVFPTREESFGLVGPEASFSGALVVANRSLNMMKEVLGSGTIAFDFGSFTNTVNQIDDEAYIHGVAMAILNRIYNNEAIITKTYCRQKYNSDNLYFRFYAPLLG